MKEDTGQIREMTPEQAKALNEKLHLPVGKQWVPVPDGEVQRVQGMNRKQRRLWAKRLRTRT